MSSSGQHQINVANAGVRVGVVYVKQTISRAFRAWSCPQCLILSRTPSIRLSSRARLLSTHGRIMLVIRIPPSSTQNFQIAAELIIVVVDSTTIQRAFEIFYPIACGRVFETRRITVICYVV